MFAYTVWECELKVCTQRDSLFVAYIREERSQVQIQHGFHLAGPALTWEWWGALLLGGQQWEPATHLPPPPLVNLGYSTKVVGLDNHTL